MILLGFVVAGSVLFGIAKGVYGLLKRSEIEQKQDYNLESYEGWIITQKINDKITIVGLPELMTLEDAKKNYNDIMFSWKDSVNIPQISFVRIGQYNDIFENYLKDSTMLISDWKEAITDYENAYNNLCLTKHSITILKETSVLLDSSYLNQELSWHEHTLQQKKNNYEYLNDKVVKMRDECFQLISKLTTVYEDSMLFEDNDTSSEEIDSEDISEDIDDNDDDDNIESDNIDEQINENDEVNKNDEIYDEDDNEENEDEENEDEENEEIAEEEEKEEKKNFSKKLRNKYDEFGTEFTAFNMREELDEGNFDESGYFVYRNRKEE